MRERRKENERLKKESEKVGVEYDSDLSYLLVTGEYKLFYSVRCHVHKHGSNKNTRKQLNYNQNTIFEESIFNYLISQCTEDFFQVIENLI